MVEAAGYHGRMCPCPLSPLSSNERSIPLKGQRHEIDIIFKKVLTISSVLSVSALMVFNKAVGRGHKTTRRERVRVCAKFEIASPRPSTWSSSPRHPLAVNEYSIPGHWIDGQNTEHRTLVLWRWRRWLQALGLFYKKNMPNNNTAFFNL